MFCFKYMKQTKHMLAQEKKLPVLCSYFQLFAKHNVFCFKVKIGNLKRYYDKK